MDNERQVKIVKIHEFKMSKTVYNLGGEMFSNPNHKFHDRRVSLVAHIRQEFFFFHKVNAVVRKVKVIHLHDQKLIV